MSWSDFHCKFMNRNSCMLALSATILYNTKKHMWYIHEELTWKKVVSVSSLGQSPNRQTHAWPSAVVGLLLLHVKNYTKPPLKDFFNSLAFMYPLFSLVIVSTRLTQVYYSPVWFYSSLLVKNYHHVITLSQYWVGYFCGPAAFADNHSSNGRTYLNHPIKSLLFI